MSSLYTITTCPLSCSLSSLFPLTSNPSQPMPAPPRAWFGWRFSDCSKWVLPSHNFLFTWSTDHWGSPSDVAALQSTLRLLIRSLYLCQGSPLLNEVSDLDLSSPFEATELRIICQMTSFAVRQRPAKKSIWVRWHACILFQISRRERCIHGKLLNTPSPPSHSDMVTSGSLTRSESSQGCYCCCVLLLSSTEEWPLHSVMHLYRIECIGAN